LLPGGASVGAATVEPYGGWTLRVPMPASLAEQDAVQRAFGRVRGAPPVKVQSFRLTIAERIPTFFTLSFPLFWALALAPPRIPRLWRVVAGGTALLALLALLSLLIYTAYTIETNLRLVTSDWAVTLWGALEYITVNVAPYLAPLVMAVWMHAGLRAQIFSLDAPVPVPATPAPATASPAANKSRRGRYRGR
jgi:hypothetical protein